MELTVFLAKVVGPFLVIGGLAVFTNREQVMFAALAIVKERFAQLFAGLCSLLIALLLINSHNDWSSIPAALISVIGWLILAKGLLYLFLPQAKLTKLVNGLTERSWYLIDGTLAILVGLYLTAYGFGWL